MRLLKLLPLLFLIQSVFAQIKITNIDKNSIPKSISYTGHIINATKYTDSEGEHLLITTETGVITIKDASEEYGKADLFAYSYKVAGNSLKLTWQMHDFVPECPVDVTAKYVPGSLAVTDLNKDGKAEIWLMYITACRGDVSPGSMKIIMHDGDKKYAMRGSNKVNVLDNKYDGGEYTFDDAFKTGPQSFRDYAQQLWKKNLLYDK
jgi:hypothetical protein